MLEVSATLVFFAGFFVGAVVGAVSVCVVAIVWKGDDDGRKKN